MLLGSFWDYFGIILGRPGWVSQCRVRGGEKPLPRGLRTEGSEGFRIDGQRVLLKHLSPRGLVGLSQTESIMISKSFPNDSIKTPT